VAIGIFDTSIDIVLPALIVALGLVDARYGPPKLRLMRLIRPIGLTPGAGVQFSLRQLMAAILLVAVVVSLARPIRAYLATAFTTNEKTEAAHNRFTAAEKEREAYEATEGTIDRLFAGTEVFGIVVVSWVATWAALGIAALWLRGTLAIVVAFALSSLNTYCFSPLPHLDDDWSMSLPIWVGQSLIIMASLLVVRCCGYRLVGRTLA
jgi:hypothetical protein